MVQSKVWNSSSSPFFQISEKSNLILFLVLEEPISQGECLTFELKQENSTEPVIASLNFTGSLGGNLDQNPRIKVKEESFEFELCEEPEQEPEPEFKFSMSTLSPEPR